MLKILLRTLLVGVFLSACGIENDVSKLKKSGQDIEEFRAVDSSCQNPRSRWGNTCAFYSECLGDSISCEDSNYPYAISYGEKYCNRFTLLQTRLSSLGQGWVRDTMYCLQENVALYSGSGSKVRNSCQGVRAEEFRWHPACYLGGPSKNSGTRHTSICALPLMDAIRVALAVDKGDLFTRESGAQAIATAKVCIPQYVGDGPLVLSPEARLQRKKLYDFWVWYRDNGEANQNGWSTPPVPASISSEFGDVG